jgi:hypothetical protein
MFGGFLTKVLRAFTQKNSKLRVFWGELLIEITITPSKHRLVQRVNKAIHFKLNV